MSPRDGRTRKADALAMLATPAIDVWVASASEAGAAHLVPLSLAWVDDHEELGAVYAQRRPTGTRVATAATCSSCCGRFGFQARREADEIEGRTLMRDDAWII